MRSASSLACHNDRDQQQLITVLGLYRFKDDGSMFAGIEASGLVTSSRKGGICIAAWKLCQARLQPKIIFS